ncbi:MAG: hypothetical protein NDI93_02055 [Pseudomonas sp.]|nr:hypothetical protein [Pseudomonas sp.]
MLATERHAPKVLTPAFSQRLRTFNDAARSLQAQGVRLLRIDLATNCLEIGAEDARRLLERVRCDGFRRRATAGSTQYECQYQGVTLAWTETISYRRPTEWAGTVTH